MGASERRIRDRAAEALGEISKLDVRPMFSGFGFYVDGLLVAAAWDSAFQLRYGRGGRWVYEPVNDSLVDDPSVLVALVRDPAEQLSWEPEARRHR